MKKKNCFRRGSLAWWLSFLVAGSLLAGCAQTGYIRNTPDKPDFVKEMILRLSTENSRPDNTPPCR